jgi:hypothetical protein
MLTVRIKSGTLEEGESLCRSCRNAHIQRGFRESEEAIFCNFGPLRPVRFKVAECTDYANRTVPYRWELEEMALRINVNPARKLTGFRTGGAGFASEDEDEDDADDVSVME